MNWTVSRGYWYFLDVNFKQTFDKVGKDLFRTLFGCVVASPSPLPRSFISFPLKREKSNLDEQEVIDAVSIFFVLRASDLTFTFLHNLIPSWLTNKNKARRFFVNTTKARDCLKNIVLEFLPSVMDFSSAEKHPSVEKDFLDFVLRVGVRVLCGCDEADSMKIVYNLMTSYQFSSEENTEKPDWHLFCDWWSQAFCLLSDPLWYWKGNSARSLQSTGEEYPYSSGMSTSSAFLPANGV